MNDTYSAQNRMNFGGYKESIYRRYGKTILLVLGMAASVGLAIAAESLIEGSPSTTPAEHGLAGNTVVFTNDSTAYAFFTGGDGTCYYRKTTNTTATWGSAVQVNAETDCTNIAVWYDQWTPGDAGSYIHIVTLHAATEELRYNRLDTSSDTLLVAAGSTPVASNGQTPTLSVGAGLPTISKGTDDTIYVAIADNADAFINECSSSCNLTSSWSETGSNPLDTSTGDMQLLVPLLGGDMMIISRNRTTDTVRSKVWNNTAWELGWTPIDNNAPESAEYELALSAVTNPVTGRVNLVYVSDHNNFSTADHDIRTAYYDSGTWTNATDIVTNDTRGITEVALALNKNTSDVYVAYGARSTINTDTTTDVYWATADTDMGSWTIDNGPLNVGQDNFYGLSTNHISGDRLYALWFEAGTNDIRGETMFDITPPLTVAATGTQRVAVRGGSTNVYIGGSFSFQEFGNGRDVTSISISETGSVDGANDIDNIRLLYELDTSAPYNCLSETYSGSELQFGGTDTNGFSGSNGVATFADSVSVASTSTLCVYVLLDVLDSAADGQTIDIEIADPSSDVLVSGLVPAAPQTSVTLTGDTDILYSNLVQNGYHWRLDDGSETAASSATGGENTVLSGLTRDTPRRLRVAVSNEGSTSTLGTTLRLEYGVANPGCGDINTWIDIDAGDDAWNMTSSPNLVHGNNTTNIATTSGGVSDANSVFLTPNGAQLEASGQTSSLVYDTTAFTEFEFSLVASTTASEGATYCFRLTEGGTPLQYNNYPAASIAADVVVSSIGSQIATADIGASNLYAGGAFTIAEAGNTRSVTNITISETGSVDAAADISNVALRYDIDTTAPYNCTSESYAVTDATFGVPVAAGFNAPNGEASFSDSVVISPTSTLCVYPVYDIDTTAQNGDTVALQISNPNAQVGVSDSGSVSPNSPIALASTTVLSGAVITQTHYQWRNDDGDETGATSATGGTEDTPLVDINRDEVYRLRLGLSNEGGTSTAPVSYQLQFGIKNTTCDVVAAWTDVDATNGDSWDMYDSTFLTHGENTTDIAIADGGVSDEESTFLTPNAGVRESAASTATTTIGSTNYVDYEFSLTTTLNTPFETDYCFRVIENGQPLPAYDVYPEVSIRANRDFKIQRGVATVAGTSQTLTAGVDYDAPSATSSAFVRITNAHSNGAGRAAGGGNQNPDDVTAYVTSADITNSFTITRDTDSALDTRIAWEIIEFVGLPSTDNEMIVREVGTVSLPATTFSATSSVVSVADDDDVVVFLTGSRMTSNRRDEYDNVLVTSDWSAGTDQAVITRDTADYEIDVAYAVVEFTGQNWQVQRVEHTFAATGAAETESITPVIGVTNAFVEGQKRMASNNNQADFGVEIWLSSMGAVSFYLDANASNPADHTAVAWVIENVQSGAGEMVVHQTNGTTSGGTEPLAQAVSFTGTGISSIENASIFGFANLDSANSFFPQVMASFRITSSSTFEVWRSDTGGTLRYRTAVVEWPTAALTYTQNYYRWYENGPLTPTSPWPPTGSDIGENSPITINDTPVGEGDVLRLRTSIQVNNADLPANLQAFKLQYGLLPEAQTCSGIASWTDVANAGSGGVWRGYDNGSLTNNAAVGTNPPAGGQLLLSVADRAGRYLESGTTAVNPYVVQAGEDVEYDWVIQHNGATQRSNYCFRVVDDTGLPLDNYDFYPQLRTQGYSPEQADWRWYDDVGSATPSVSLAAENTAPVEIDKGEQLKLRLLIQEVNNLEQADARFRLQFSDTATFDVVYDVVAEGSCTVSDIWCYTDGGGVDNAVIPTALLSNTATCTGGVGTGCGTYNESPLALTGYTHDALSATEFEFSLEHQLVPGYYGQVWYFRVYDVLNDDVVPLAAGAQYPSAVSESGSITFSVSGLPAATTTESVVTTASTTATSISFGALVPDTDVRAAQRLRVETSAFGGYRVETFARQQLQNEEAVLISNIAGTNEVPVGWSLGCSGLPSCFAYHAGDDTLSGSAGRFALDNSYAAASTTPAEIMFSATPGTDVSDIVYRLVAGGTQAAGIYTTDIVYLVTPVF